jgi:Family of unknown function (DUF6492)
VGRTERLDAVLPLTIADAERAQILFRSLEALFEPLGRCYVVAPDEDVHRVRRVVPHARYSVVPESDVVRELGYFRTTAKLRQTLHIVGPPIHGWYVQQLVKLAVAPRLATPFYLTLDADVVCVRPTRYDDLVRDGRGVVQMAPPNHPEWNDDAERVLALPRSGRQYGVTPAILSKDAVAELSRHLGNRVDARLRRLARRLPAGRSRELVASWRSFLLRNLPWTEYAVYHTFLEGTGRWSAYHVDGGTDAIYSDCVWLESQFDEWDPLSATSPFTLVQSATRIPAGRVWERVAPAVTSRSLARG